MGAGGTGPRARGGYSGAVAEQLPRQRAGNRAQRQRHLAHHRRQRTPNQRHQLPTTNAVQQPQTSYCLGPGPFGLLCPCSRSSSGASANRAGFGQPGDGTAFGLIGISARPVVCVANYDHFRIGFHTDGFPQVAHKTERPIGTHTLSSACRLPATWRGPSIEHATREIKVQASPSGTSCSRQENSLRRMSNSSHLRRTSRPISRGRIERTGHGRHSPRTSISRHPSSGEIARS